MPYNEKGPYSSKNINNFCSDFKNIFNEFINIKSIFYNKLDNVFKDSKEIKRSIMINSSLDLSKIFITLDLNNISKNNSIILNFLEEYQDIIKKYLEDNKNKEYFINNNKLEKDEINSRFILVTIDFTKEIIDINTHLLNFLNEFLNKVFDRIKKDFKESENLYNNYINEYYKIFNSNIIYRLLFSRFYKKMIKETAPIMKYFEKYYFDLEPYSRLCNYYLFLRYINEIKKFLEMRFSAEFNITENYFKENINETYKLENNN